MGVIREAAMRKAVPGAVALVSLLAGTPLRAQVAWDAPLMVASASPRGWGLYLTDPAGVSGIGVMTTWRGGGPMGYRIGLADDDQDVSVFGGVDISGELLAASDDFPLDVGWVTGAGLGSGSPTLITIPLGLTVSRQLQAEATLFNPYATPRVVLDAFVGDEDQPAESGAQNGRRDDVELGLEVDLGLDLSFDPGWAVRFAGTFGEHDALAIGFSFRLL